MVGGEETDTTYIRWDPYDGDDEYGNGPVWWPSHCWFIHEGKHYDAECPQGVDCWHDLPIFKKWIKRKKLVFVRDCKE